MKKPLSIILIISMLLSFIFTLNVWADGETVVVDGIEYTSHDTYCAVTGYDENRYGELIIPSTVTFGEADLPVTEIGDEAFKKCLHITSIIIPDSVTSIGSSAFADCSFLENISLGNGIVTIGTSAFRNSAITSVIIPDGVTCIPDYAFNSCRNLKSIIIPNSVRVIGKYAFWYCSSIEKAIYLDTAEYWNIKVSLPTDFNDANNGLKFHIICHPDHDFSEEIVIKAATCEGEDGEVEQICGVCGYSERQVVKGGHVLSEIKHNDKKHWYVCERCGERIDVNLHIYEEHIIQKLSCTDNGEIEYVCKVCGYTENSVTEKLGHSQGDIEYDEHNHWRECTRCGKMLEIEAHTFSDERVLIYPTYERNGEAEHTCTKCGYIERYAIESVKYENNDIADGILNIVIGEKVTAAPGETIDVKIKLVNNGGISSVKIILTYDPRLSIVLDEKGDPCAELDIADLSDESMQRAVTFRADDNILILNWLSSEREVVGDVTYATIKFKVEDGTKDKEFLPIMAIINPNDIFDIDKNNVDYNIVSNGVEVRALKPGDLNGDGELNNKDVVMLFRYVSSGDIYEDEYVFDFSGDGKVDNKDVVSLFRRVSSVN